MRYKKKEVQVLVNNSCYVNVSAYDNITDWHVPSDESKKGNLSIMLVLTERGAFYLGSTCANTKLEDGFLSAVKGWTDKKSRGFCATEY